VGDLLPFNTFGLDNATGGNPNASQFYVAGDVRANEQVGLTAIHTLMMREHNRIADELATANYGTDEEIYQRARKLVGAEIQVITYKEFLPALLGNSLAPGVESVYDPSVNAGVANAFSTALYRVGHTMLPPRLMRMTNDGDEAGGGHMPLREAFFKPSSMGGTGELEYLLKGLASDQQQEVDMLVIDDVRNFLFGPPGAGGFDLPSLNIQRGRDHGLPDYNTMRLAYGLPAIDSFDDISSDLAFQTALQSLYNNDVNNIDAWVGAIAEDHLPGAAVGELITYGLIDQFTRARDGDRFWFMNDADLSPEDLDWLTSLRLSDVILANTGVTHLQQNVFFMIPEPSTWALAFVGGAAASLARRRRMR
jgi:hypothetical protein